MEWWQSITQVGGWVGDFLGFQVAVFDGQPITVGKMLAGLVLFVVGYRACRQASATIDRRLLSRLDLDSSLRSTLESAIFYVLLIFLTLFVLRLLNVPLTVFTVVGGALAIGVGFGSQNIVNNFFSGLIIMMEHSVKVGDVIELEGVNGTIEQIGARSTRIRSVRNMHYIVPNSWLLEKSVLNWTHADSKIRTSVKVGVGYGSPVRKVEELLLRAGRENEYILKAPGPFVVFEDFGDNALAFELFYWVDVGGPYELRQIASQLRFRIDELFKEDKIEIPFPQRDIHLDSKTPIEVKVLPSQLS